MVLTETQLKALQQKECELLRAVIDVCDKLGIKYYLLGGTLLGAVRHGGFIPWDDDIDIGMYRADYERFIREAQALLPDWIFVQTILSEPNFPLNYCKVRNSNTAFMETSIRKIKINKGFFVDVFPLDYFPKSDQEIEELYAKKEKLMVACRKAFYGKSIKSKIGKILRSIGTLGLSYQKANQKLDELYKKYSEGDLVANHNGSWGEKEIVPSEWYGEGQILNFDGIPCCVPAEYDKWLTQVYGNYMELPPPDKRVSHHFIDAVDAERSYKFYQK